jgi:hypothetical protein
LSPYLVTLANSSNQIVSNLIRHLDRAVEVIPAISIAIDYPEEVKSYNFQFHWTPGESNDEGLLNELLPESTVLKLESMTNCTLFKSLNDVAVFIGAHVQEDLLRMRQKLDVMYKHFVSPLPWHFPYFDVPGTNSVTHCSSLGNT